MKEFGYRILNMENKILDEQWGYDSEDYADDDGHSNADVYREEVKVVVISRNI